MPTPLEKIIAGAKAFRLEFSAPPGCVPAKAIAVTADDMRRIITGPDMKLRPRFDWERAVPMRRVISGSRFTLNLSRA